MKKVIIIISCFVIFFNFNIKAQDVLNFQCYRFHVSPNSYCSDSLLYSDSANLNNSWIMGYPQKNLLNWGGSAIFTDSMYYSPSNTSSFYISYVNHNPYFNIGFTVGYYIDADTLQDFGKIYYWDGNKWIDMIENYSILGNYGISNSSNETIFSSANSPYDSIYNPFTGYYKDKSFEYGLKYNAPGLAQQDTVKFRYDFISDSIDNHREGWLIYHILFGEYPSWGIKNYSENKFVIYPNPVISTLNIAYNFELNKNYFINIYDMLGNLILTEALGVDKRVDMQNVSSGTYFYGINDNNKVLQRGIIVKQ